MKISNKYIAVEKLEPEVKEGFQTVEIQDDFVYKGRVVNTSCNDYKLGDVILFAKYSPDTHEIEHEGKTLKFVSIEDVLAKL